MYGGCLRGSLLMLGVLGVVIQLCSLVSSSWREVVCTTIARTAVLELVQISRLLVMTGFSMRIDAWSFERKSDGEPILQPVFLFSSPDTCRLYRINNGTTSGEPPLAHVAAVPNVSAPWSSHAWSFWTK